MIRSLLTAATLFGLSTAQLAADDYTLAKSDAAPAGVAEAVAAQLDPQGLALQRLAMQGPERPYATLWFVKSAVIPSDFQSSAAIRYPFTPGQLIGVLSIPKRAEFHDFRGNELDAGVYTLRYGQQPMDGNHIGTSDLADFLVAIPAAKDEDPATITDLDQLVQLSAEASGTTHPAIFSLQPVEAKQDAATLTRDEAREFWILQVNTPVQRGDKADHLPLRMVIVGVSEG